jgi:1A family penicillin-binding protein
MTFFQFAKHIVHKVAIAAAIFAAVGPIAALALLGMIVWFLESSPNIPTSERTAQYGFLLEAENGQPIGRVGTFAASGERNDFPEHLVKAVLSVEDRRFYQHFGIDPIGLLRALGRNIAAGAIVEGGSTITQQLVKIETKDNDRTYRRKLREALAAVWMELRHSKDEILRRYLNSVYMGAGARGMTAAARLYFDKRPSELSLAQAAMLAGIIKAPSEYNPLSNIDRARQRAAVVLESMIENGAIDRNSALQAKAEPASIALAPDASPARSWFADWVSTQAAELVTPIQESVRVRTTLVPKLQELAEEVVREALVEDGQRKGVSQAALVALRPNGAVVAMVGGLDYSESPFNRTTDAKRQPGSAFKLFVYLAALRHGYHPDSLIDASPIQVKQWRPENFGSREYRSITLADAFAHSVNTAAVRLTMDVGVDQVISAARDLGIDSDLPRVPSLALGAAEISLLGLTGAYASAAAGRKIEPWGISALSASDGAGLRALGPYLESGRPLGQFREPLVDLLQQVITRGTGRAAALDAFAAGKTGTSQHHRDAWFIGFNESLVVGVWVGNDDGTPMKGVVGGTLPATIWKRFVKEASKLIEEHNDPPRPRDSNLVVGAYNQSSENPPPQTHCDIEACSDAYRSFRASDCTYQPYDGPRKLCSRGDPSAPPRTDGALVRIRRGMEVLELRVPREARAQMQCNITACSRHYQSFDVSDCTYQPYGGGPRRLCQK